MFLGLHWPGSACEAPQPHGLHCWAETSFCVASRILCCLLEGCGTFGRTSGVSLRHKNVQTGAERTEAFARLVSLCRAREDRILQLCLSSGHPPHAVEPVLEAGAPNVYREQTRVSGTDRAALRRLSLKKQLKLLARSATSSGTSQAAKVTQCLGMTLGPHMRVRDSKQHVDYSQVTRFDKEASVPARTSKGRCTGRANLAVSAVHVCQVREWAFRCLCSRTGVLIISFACATMSAYVRSGALACARTRQA